MNDFNVMDPPLDNEILVIHSEQINQDQSIQKIVQHLDDNKNINWNAKDHIGSLYNESSSESQVNQFNDHVNMI